MAERRRYSKLQKAEAVGLSVVKGTRPAAEQLGVPESSLRYWREEPEFARLRAETREDVAADVYAVFQKGVRRIEELLPTTEDMAKVAVATGILYDKFALMSGQATMRTENLALSERMNDHEKDALADAIDEWLKVKP